MRAIAKIMHVYNMGSLLLFPISQYSIAGLGYIPIPAVCVSWNVSLGSLDFPNVMLTQR